MEHIPDDRVDVAVTLTTTISVARVDADTLGELLRHAVFGPDGYRIEQLSRPLVGRGAPAGDEFAPVFEEAARDAEAEVHRGVWTVPAGGQIGAWTVSQTTTVRWQWSWCGDGTLMFSVVGDRDSASRTVVNRDAKKPYGWRDT